MSETGGGTPGYAIIGTGMMGREHIRAILQLKQARIVGIFDEDAGSVKRASANSLSQDMTRQLSTPVSMNSPTMIALMPF